LTMDKELIRQIVREVLAEMMSRQPAPVRPRPTSDEPKPMFRRVITESDLKQLASSGQKIVELPQDAILTPLAKDFIFEKKLTVRWTGSKKET